MLRGALSSAKSLSGKLSPLHSEGVAPEAIEITENGIYTAPYGKAYTPVTVNVEGLVPSGTLIADGDGYIYVPANLVSAYQADASWQAYSNQIQSL